MQRLAQQPALELILSMKAGSLRQSTSDARAHICLDTPLIKLFELKTAGKMILLDTPLHEPSVLDA